MEKKGMENTEIKNTRIGNAVRKRDPRYDCLRSLAAAAIIMVHVMPVETAGRGQWIFNHLTTPVLLSFVGIYFMLSGMFLLERGTEHLGEFYKKRLIQVGIPFLLYGLIYYCYNVYADGIHLPLWQHPLVFLRQAVTAGIPRAGHLWFMYGLAAFYLCAPFLSRMVKAMTDQELAFFLILMFGIHMLESLGEILGIDIKPWAQFILYTGWVYYFLLGYGLKRLWGQRKIKGGIGGLCFLGSFGLLLDLGADCLLSGWIPSTPHKLPSMTFLCISIFLAFEQYGNRIPQWAGKIGQFVGRYSFSIYLIHFLILSYFVHPKLTAPLFEKHYIGGTAAETAITFLLSLGVSVFLDWAVTDRVKGLVILVKGRKLLYNGKQRVGSKRQKKEDYGYENGDH